MSKGTGLFRWSKSLYVGDAVSKKEKKQIINEVKDYTLKGEKDRSKRLLYYVETIYKKSQGEELPKWVEKGEETYIITLSWSKKDMLDLYPAHCLLQNHFVDYPICIIGIAKGYKDAVKVATSILQDYFKDIDEDYVYDRDAFMASFEFEYL